MNEIAAYDAYKKKLQGICDENNLTFRIQHDRYPMTLTIRPIAEFYAQVSMLEAAEEEGYTSPDAYLRFSMEDGEIKYRTDAKFTISDALFSKLKNLFRNLNACWTQFFFRDVTEHNILQRLGYRPEIDMDGAELPGDIEPLEDFADEPDDPEEPEEPEEYEA